MDEQPPDVDPAETPRRRSRARDVWQLDVPLAIALIICVSATVIEFNRASDGNWRAGVYMIEWPLIGAFCVWMWFRFRREGGSFRGIADRWRDRVARYEAEAAADETQPAPATPRPDDPDRDRWEQYVTDLQRRQPPTGHD